MNRRQFLKHTAVVSLGTVTASTAGRRALGANERVHLALLGCGGRGRALARGFIECGAAITELCDLDATRLDHERAGDLRSC